MESHTKQASVMTDSTHYRTEHSGTTPRQPTNLRRSRTRLPVSASPMLTSEPSSDRLDTNIATRESNLASSKLATSLPSRRTPKVLSTSKPSNNTTKDMHAESRIGSGPASISNSSSMNHQKRGRGLRPPMSRLKTPSLVSGSSASMPDSERSALRREDSSLDKYASKMMVGPDGMQGSYRAFSPSQDACKGDPFPSAILGISIPTVVNYSPGLYGRQGYDVGRQHDPSGIGNEEDHTQPFQYASTLHEFSATPSSRCSESPFSILSTPTSASSYSPAIPVGRHTKYPSVGDQNSSAKRQDPLRIRIDDSSSVTTSTKTGKLPENNSNARNVSEEESKFPPPTSGAGVSSILEQIEIPPELAHLNVDSPPTSSSPASRLPPRRPSRDGTPNLLGQHENRSVVQSNLPANYSPFTRRTPSLETSLPTKSPAGSSRRLFGFSSRSSSRESSTRPADPKSLSPPAPDHDDVNEYGRQDSPMTGIVASPKPSRFGFLSKQSRDGAGSLEKPERSRKRGPAAGTGHEGYTRLGFRGRSGSIFGSGSFGRSPSTESIPSPSTQTFFGKKAKVRNEDEDALGIFSGPKISAGSYLSDQSTTWIPDPSRTDHSKAPYDADISPKQMVRTLGNLSEHQKDTNVALKESNTPEYAGDGDLKKTGTRALKQNLPGRILFGVTYEKDADGEEGHWLRPMNLNSHNSQARPSNFANRLFSESSPRSVNIGTDTDDDQEVAHQMQGKYAHYALARLDPSVSLDDVQRLANLKAQDMASKVGGTSLADSDLISPRVPYEKRHADLMPFPPQLNQAMQDDSQENTSQESLARKMSGDSPQLLKAETATSARLPQIVDIPSSPAGTRPHDSLTPRLSSVGRIPRVVSKKDRERKLSDRSFSRPFAQAHPKPSINPTLSTKSTETAPLPTPSLPTLPRNYSLERSGGNKGNHNFQPTTNNQSTSVEQFLAFPSRKNSELSYTSSSQDSPVAVSPTLAVYADDSWSEYNDLCEENMNVVSARTSYHNAHKPTVRQDRSHPKRVLERPSQNRESACDVTTAYPRENLGSNIGQHRLSRSAQSGSVPGTPFSISDYLTDCDRNSKSSDLARHSTPRPNDAARIDSDSLPSAKKKSTGNMTLHGQSVGPSEPTLARSVTAAQNAIVPATGEFRHAALVTSKWLSFGRVLFSPVHNEAKAGGDARILVIDGLGKEWSYYCALSYPACQFYHLGPEPTAVDNDAVPNYRHVPHSSLSAAFPFPRSFFAGVILRFPRVASDAGYQACISEVKRTLRPGGYLEMSTLDLDLVNMGSKARRAVKELKVRLHQKDDQFSLWNQGDIFLKLLGRRGFENIRRCAVALPAAGKVSQGHEPVDPRGRMEPLKEILPSVGEAVDAPGLAELLRNRSDDDQLDEQITKTVARVGRWWYSTCYEEAVASPGGTSEPSLWTTPGLTQEMEEHGTSLRLLICSAQKPTCAKRRTASV